MHCYKATGKGHPNEFHYKKYSKEIADRIIEGCSGFSCIYVKQFLVDTQLLTSSVREVIVRGTNLQGSYLTSDIENFIFHRSVNSSKSKSPVLLYFKKPVEDFDWCHIFADTQTEEDAVVCITPLSKKVEVCVSDISECFLESAAREIGINYQRFRYQQGYRAGRLFNKVFPQINENSIPRVYKQNVIDFVTSRWMKRRRKPAFAIHPESQSALMKLIDKAFEAYQIESVVMDILKIKKEERRSYIR